MSRAKKWALLLIAVCCVAAAVVVVTRAGSGGGNVATDQEFNGNSLEESVWTIQTGGGGWGNNELQTYTREAVTVAEGQLRLTASIAGTSADPQITSGRITTQGRWSFTYGTLSARIRLPEGTGLLPAFWLLGDDLNRVGWPAAGEIDVVETPSSTRKSVHSVHGPLASDSLTQWQQNVSVSHDPPLADGFHVYTVHREPNLITIWIDEQKVFELDAADLGENQRWVFDDPFHVVLSLAVGGNWPGDPDATTPAESVMAVDWIRFQPLAAA